MFATFDIQLSIFATYASTKATSEEPGAIPDLFGRPVIGTTVDGDDSQNIYGSRFTTGIRAGRLASISVFVAAPVDRAPPRPVPAGHLWRLAWSARSSFGDDRVGSAGARCVEHASNQRGGSTPRTSYWLMYNSNGTNVAVNNTTYTAVAGNPIDLAIRSHQPARPSLLADRLTAPADMRPMVAGIVLTAGLFAATGRPRAGIVLLVGFVLALLAAGAVRAHLFDPYSYPSGHALRSTYVAIAFCFAVPSRSFGSPPGCSSSSSHSPRSTPEATTRRRSSAACSSRDDGLCSEWRSAGRGHGRYIRTLGLDTASVIDLTDGTSGQVVMEGKSE